VVVGGLLHVRNIIASEHNKTTLSRQE